MSDVHYNEQDNFFFWIEDGKTVKVTLEFKVRDKIGGKADLLSKALGKSARVLDGTAGLCRDALHMAHLGKAVTACEVNADLFRGLQKSLAAYRKDHRDIQLLLLNKDVIDVLQARQDFDVIYLDPMFPEKKKSAKAGKESQLLQMLCPPPFLEDEKQLLAACRKSGIKKIVVKRPLHSPYLAMEKPHHSILGKAVRFDVY